MNVCSLPLKTLAEEYSRQVAAWPPGLPPCGIASYNLAETLRSCGRPASVVYGVYNDIPHFWVEAEDGGDTKVLDSTGISGRHYGTAKEMRALGYYRDRRSIYGKGGVVERFDWGKKEDRGEARAEISGLADDPELKEYRPSISRRGFR